MTLVFLVIVLTLLFALLEFFLLGRRGFWKLTALIPVVLLAAAALCCRMQYAEATGWGRFEAQLELLVYGGSAAAGILLGGLVRGVLLLLAWIGGR